MLMSTKGLQRGKNEAAHQLEVQDALYTAFEDTGICPLCSSLDGLECRMPSEEFDRYAPPQHCFCNCLWVYVNQEEKGWKPDNDWNGEIPNAQEAYRLTISSTSMGTRTAPGRRVGRRVIMR